MLTNEERAEDAVTADPDATAYQGLITPYPVWAGLHECGIKRDDHHLVSSGLFHDDFQTCIDVDRDELKSYFKSMALYANRKEGKIPLSIAAKNSMVAFVQWAKDKIRCGKDPAMYQYENKNVSLLIKRAKTH